MRKHPKLSSLLFHFESCTYSCSTKLLSESTFSLEHRGFLLEPSIIISRRWVFLFHSPHTTAGKRKPTGWLDFSSTVNPDMDASVSTISEIPRSFLLSVKFLNQTRSYSVRISWSSVSSTPEAHTDLDNSR